MRTHAEMLRIIREEWDTRLERWEQSTQDDADDRLRFYDAPLIGELCLLLLVSLWHQLEREIVWFAAEVSLDGREYDHPQYRQAVAEKREQWRTQSSSVIRELDLERQPEWLLLRLLREISNCYKHDPWLKPGTVLLRSLSLDTSRKYAALYESDAVQDALATSLNLSTRPIIATSPGDSSNWHHRSDPG